MSLLKLMAVITLLVMSAFSAIYAAPTVIYGFDGTGQNREHNEFTNVYHFMKAHRPTDSSVQDVYAPGVGSAEKFKFGFKNIPGIVTGDGGKEIIEDMYSELVNNFKKGHTGIVLVGFSRGAALAREFANVVYDRGNPLHYKKGKRPYGKSPTIKFMALFDSVYSFGLPFGKKDRGYRKQIPINVKAVAHATAGLEKRNTFDLWSIHSSKDDLNKVRGNFAEREFEGGHDDIGGAEENNYHGFEPLKWVIGYGREAGVRLAKPIAEEYRNGEEVDTISKGSGNRQIYHPKKLKKVKAYTYKVAKKGCKGKQVYLSGTKCYTCPDGFRRYSPTRKMTHPKACVKRGFGVGKEKKKAKYAWGANGCPQHQFKYKGYCMKCPAGTKRSHIAGIDTGMCKVNE